MEYLKTLKGLLLTLLLVCVGNVSAHDFEVDGIYYNILSEEDKTVEVTYKGSSNGTYSNEYIGNVIIPGSVTKSAETNLIVLKTLDAWTSTNKSHSTTSQANYTLNVDAGNILKFDWSVSSESNYDWLIITLDGVEIIKKSGIQSGSYEKTFDSTGSHSLAIRYTKDGSQSKGNDEGKIYNITLNNVVSTTSGITYRVTAIGDCAFYDCDLTSITIANGIVSIGNRAFDWCSNLSKIEIPYSLTNINDEAFRYSGIISITIPSSVIHIGNRVFEGCKKLASIIVESGNVIYDSRENCNAIIKTETNTLIVGCENTIIPNSVNVIGEEAFYQCLNLTSIDIPNGVNVIGKNAFYNCAYLTKVNIPNSVTVIDDGAFDSCFELASLILGNGVQLIGNNAFRYCRSLEGITIASSVTSIGEYAFGCCDNIRVIKIPSSVMTIGQGAFDTCYNLFNIFVDEDNLYYDSRNNCNAIIETATNTLIAGCKYTVIPNGVKNIKKHAFRNCLNLTSITIPNSVTAIEDEAFYNCRSLKSIAISNGVTSIGEYAFYNCIALKKITIPNSVVTIGDYAFQDCVNLTTATIGDGLASIGCRTFSNCTALKNVEIGNNVAIIEIYAFEDCVNIASVEIPNSVTSIRYGAFDGCSALTRVEIPNGVTNVEYYAFYGCTNLIDVCFYSNPTIGKYAIPSTATCHLVLDDGNSTDFDITNTNTYSDVSYTRTIAEGKYGTIMLPFAPDAASIENYAFYELVESGEGYMKFDEVAQPIANTPYIYTLREGKENVAITGGETTISSTVETPVVDGWQTIGSFTNQALDTSDGNYYAFSPSKNEINKITKNLTVLPYRAYFKSSNASKSALSIYISGTTGVKEISSNEIDGFENGAIFDLSGRKVAEPRKGNIYIKNGKKIMF